MGLKEWVVEGWEYKSEKNVPEIIWGILWESLCGHFYSLNTYCVLNPMGGAMEKQETLHLHEVERYACRWGAKLLFFFFNILTFA